MKTQTTLVRVDKELLVKAKSNYLARWSTLLNSILKDIVDWYLTLIDWHWYSTEKPIIKDRAEYEWEGEDEEGYEPDLNYAD
jgi:hypothetical protein